MQAKPIYCNSRPIFAGDFVPTNHNWIKYRAALEWFMEIVQESIRMCCICQFASTVNTGGTKHFMLYPSMRDHSLVPPLIRTFAMYFIKWIFHEAVMYHKVSERRWWFFTILVWYLLPDQFQQFNVCTNVFNSPTLFSNRFDNLHHPEINAEAQLKKVCLPVNYTQETQTYFFIFRFLFCPTTYRVMPIPSIEYTYKIFHNLYP